MSDRRTFLRRRVMPVAFVAALALLAGRTCQTELATAEFRFEFGDRAAQIDHFRVELFAPKGTDLLGYFELKKVIGTTATWPVTADPGPYQLHIKLTVDGDVRELRRTAELRERAVIEVDLSGEIDGPS